MAHSNAVEIVIIKLVKIDLIILRESYTSEMQTESSASSHS